MRALIASCLQLLGVTSAIRPKSPKWDALREALGEDLLVLPQDDGFAAAKVQWNLLSIQKPLGVAFPSTEAHVAATVAWAAANGVNLWARSTGHGAPRPSHGSLIVDVSKIHTLSIDAASKIATIGAGVHWDKVITAASPLGLAAPVGTALSVSAVGFTIGGGLGFLGRSAGYAADYLISARVVVADGSVRVASADAADARDRELLFALRGGGGAYGIITEMTFQLVNIAPKIFAGAIYYPISAAPGVFKAYGEWIKTLPETVTSMISFSNFPGASRSVGILAAVTDVTKGVELMAPMRTLPYTAISDSYAEMPFSAIGTVLGGVDQPIPFYERGANVKKWTPEVEQTFLDMFSTDTPQIEYTLVEIRHLGGAVKYGAPNGPGGLKTSAVGQRDAEFTAQLITLVTPGDKTALATATKLGKQYAKLMAPFHTTGPILNHLGWDSGAKGDQESFTPETLARIRAVKSSSDPDGLFRHAHIGLFKEDSGHN